MSDDPCYQSDLAWFKTHRGAVVRIRRRRPCDPAINSLLVSVTRAGNTLVYGAADIEDLELFQAEHTAARKA